MRKIVVIGISILSVFILYSLSYQPIIADTPIENIPIIKKSKASDLDADELKELYNKLLEMKSQSNDDCGCGDTTGFSSGICMIFAYIILLGFIFWLVFTVMSAILIETGYFLFELFNCTYYPDL